MLCVILLGYLHTAQKHMYIHTIYIYTYIYIKNIFITFLLKPAEHCRTSLSRTKQQMPTMNSITFEHEPCLHREAGHGQIAPLTPQVCTTQNTIPTTPTTTHYHRLHDAFCGLCGSVFPGPQGSGDQILKKYRTQRKKTNSFTSSRLSEIPT